MIVSCRGNPWRLPDFLVVGAARSGTTSLCSLLATHPRVFFPPEKEPMFFSVYGQPSLPVDVRTRRQAEFVVHDLEKYVELFSEARPDQLLGEGSTWYLYFHQATTRNIKKIYGLAASALRILIILRNPVERAWSHYWLKKRDGEERLSFEEATDPVVVEERQERNLLPGFDYLGFGRYYLQVQAYMEAFEKVKVLLVEDLARDPSKVMSEVFRFVGLEPVPISNEAKRHNVAGAPKNQLSAYLGKLVYEPHSLKFPLKLLIPGRVRARWKSTLSESLFRPQPLPERVRKKLQIVYREDILALSHLIGRDLRHWLR
ncbi:MAG: sulfotransferase [Clostridiales bacterium]|nr:sulfotransferase [Clostridiales bacterium]